MTNLKIVFTDGKEKEYHVEDENLKFFPFGIMYKETSGVEGCIPYTMIREVEFRKGKITTPQLRKLIN